jgi:hypothetical protein
MALEAPVFRETLEGGRERSGKPLPSRRSRAAGGTSRLRYAVGRSVAHTGPRAGPEARRSRVRGPWLPTPHLVAACASQGRYRGFPLCRLRLDAPSREPGQPGRRARAHGSLRGQREGLGQAGSPPLESRNGPGRGASHCFDGPAGSQRTRSVCRAAGFSPFWGQPRASTVTHLAMRGKHQSQLA